MLDENTNEVQFSPRPEAHAMNWDDLLPPVRHAVRDLLIRIDGAVSSSEEKDLDGKIVSNSFLVYGARGTGKTTVLHSAKKAVLCCAGKEDNYFSETEAHSLEGSANTSAKSLKQKDIIWLDILDLEPLPKKANLLTILLTRILNSLDQPNCNRKKPVPRSIFEEDSDSARQLLRHLINDATLLWEDVHEADTRNIANRQIEAADIYTTCCARFKDAMDKLSQELSRIHGHDNDKGCSIILPIDNIDRSTDHLQSLVKLAQMVSHPKLWLVMAGDRIEVETFLERAYWKELIHSDDSAGAQGKMSSGGEDEALVMARRQAAAVAQKIWPPNHRLEVSLVRPLETLRFSPNNKSQEMTIYQLLEQVNIPTTCAQRKEVKGDQKTINQKRIKLINLFDIQDKLGTPSVSNDKDKILLTRAAQHGLRLPARAVLDLWQLAYWVVNDLTKLDTSDFRAEKIARTMLRNVINESKMSNKIGQLLQNEIICRTDNSGTMLEFIGVTIDIKHQYKTEFELPFIYNTAENSNSYFKIRSKLSVNRIEDMVLSLIYTPPNQDKNGNKEVFIEKLPHQVASWLMVLYDILMMAEFESESGVLHGGLNQNKSLAISVTHQATGNFLIETLKDLDWPIPNWKSFLAHEIFKQQWKAFFTVINIKLQSKDIPLLVPLLQATWISCVLKTFLALNPNLKGELNGCNKKYDFLKELNSILTLDIKKNTHSNSYKKIIPVAIDLYSILENDTKDETEIGVKEKTAMNKWLEDGLPLLLSQLYVPLDNKPPVLDEKEMKGSLIDYWIENTHFIQANIASELVNIFPDNGDTTENNSSNHDYSGFINNQMTWALGVNLSQLLNSDSSQTGS